MIVSMLKTCWTNSKFEPGSWMFPATIKPHKIATPPIIKILRRLSIIICRSLPQWALFVQFNADVLLLGERASYDRISASAHAGSTGNPGNKGIRQIFIVSLVAS
jgi:hypothetical protein